MRVLSLFDGISCGQLALQRAGINVSRYLASEIKPTALAVTEANFPDTVFVGDVSNLDADSLGEVDLLIGGSPCKGLSRINSRREGLSHPESRLFYEYLRILDELKPAYFLLENTQGHRESTDTITRELGVSPVSINSRLVSFQNRPRYYWTNIPLEGLPQDKGILFNPHNVKTGDVVSASRAKWLSGPSGKSSVQKGYTKVNPEGKIGCLTANGHKKWNENYLYRGGKYYHLHVNTLEAAQTLPEGYCSNVLSYKDAYDVIGDAWTVDVIAHIMRSISNA